MEQTPNNPQASSGKNVSYQFLVEQSHSIQRLHEVLHSNMVAHGLNAFLSVIVQIVCYLIFILTIFLAITMPGNLQDLMIAMEADAYLVVPKEIYEPIAEFLMSIKIILAVVALPVLFCAMLLGRNRRRAARMRRAFEELETLKRSHSYMMSTMK